MPKRALRPKCLERHQKQKKSSEKVKITSLSFKSWEKRGWGLIFSGFSSHRCVFLFDILSSVFLSEYSGLPKDSQLDWQTLYFREVFSFWESPLYFAVRCEGVVLQNSYPAYSSSVTFACHSKVITDLKNSSPQQISPEDVSITSSNRGKDQYFIYNWELDWGLI